MVPYKISIFIWFEFLDGCNCTTNLTYILYLVLKRIWNLIDFQGQRSRSPGQIFETIQYALCHRKFSYMINQKFMKLCTLQDPNMKMCTLVGYPSPLSFIPVILLWT